MNLQRMVKWNTAILIHDRSASDDVTRQVSIALRQHVAVSTFDLGNGNFSFRLTKFCIFTAAEN